MGPKINVRARIERHSRVLQHHLYAGTKKTGKTGIALISAIAVLLFPIYPSFASFVGNNSVTEFYRGDIDESSIIDSYFGENDTVGDGDVFIQSKDSYLYVNASYEEGARDVTTSNEIVEYEVQSGDSVALIAQRF